MNIEETNIFRSKDLINWKKNSLIRLEKMTNCEDNNNYTDDNNNVIMEDDDHENSNSNKINVPKYDINNMMKINGTYDMWKGSEPSDNNPPVAPYPFKKK